MPDIVGHAYMYDKHAMSCVKIKNISLGKNNASSRKRKLPKCRNH